jgi:hypothetical protein
MQIESATTPVPDFTGRRMAILNRLEELSREEGSALLDGKPFNRAKTDKLKAELEALDSAEGEASRRGAEKAAIEAARLRKERLAGLTAAEDARLAAVDRAEAAARELADALVAAEKAKGEVLAINSQLGGKPIMALLDHETRLSRRLSAVLAQLTGLRGRYGHITTKEALPHERGPWRDSEAALVAPYLPTRRKPENVD